MFYVLVKMYPKQFLYFNIRDKIEVKTYQSEPPSRKLLRIHIER